jgi:hypothetical protein
MSRKNILIILTFICFNFVACSESESDIKNIPGPIEITLDPYVSRLVTVKAIVGADTLKLLFDTGGGETFICPDVAQRLNCNPSGRSIGFRMSGEKVISQYCHDVTLTIGGVSFNHDLIGVWDINSVLPKNLPRLDGILSLKTFYNQPFSLNLASKSLTLETKKSLIDRVRNMTPLRSRIATGPDGSELTLFLHGKIQEFGWFLLDSGNLDAVLVAPYLDFDKTSDSTDTVDIWKSNFIFSDLSSLSTRFRTKDIIYDGALSEEFMRDWIFTFDLSSNSVWASSVATSLSE